MAISRSKWDSFIKCPLCFYLLEKHQIKPPGTPGHPINSRVDALLKEEFDELRAKGEPHPIFKEYKLNMLYEEGYIIWVELQRNEISIEWMYT